MANSSTLQKAPARFYCWEWHRQPAEPIVSSYSTFNDNVNGAWPRWLPWLTTVCPCGKECHGKRHHHKSIYFISDCVKMLNCFCAFTFLKYKNPITLFKLYSAFMPSFSTPPLFSTPMWAYWIKKSILNPIVTPRIKIRSNCEIPKDSHP